MEHVSDNHLVPVVYRHLVNGYAPHNPSLVASGRSGLVTGGKILYL